MRGASKILLGLIALFAATANGEFNRVKPEPTRQDRRVDPEDLKVLFGPRFLTGIIFGPVNVGVTYAWNPLVYQEKNMSASLILGLVHVKDKTNVELTGLELGWIVSPEIGPGCTADIGAMLAHYVGGTSGMLFELYFGVSYNPHALSFWDRISLAYTPILVRNANIHAIRFSLGFDF